MQDHVFTLLSEWINIFLSPHSRFFLPYLYITLLLALAICYWRARSLRGAFRAVFRRDVFLHRSSLNDYKLAFFNFFLIVFVFGFAVGSAVTLTRQLPEAINAMFGHGPQWRAGVPDAVIYSFALMLAYDGGNFVQHWLQHKVPVLWELHKVHHSAEVMTPVTATRVHPLAALFSALMVSVSISLVNGVFFYLYDGPIALYTLLGANSFMVLHYTVGVYHLQHSHIWISFPPGIRGWLVSPAMHMIHHSADPKHFDKNFSFVLSVWDRMAGTLYIPDDPEQHGLVLGLGESEQAEMQTTWQLYTTPLKHIARMTFRRRPKRQRAEPPIRKPGPVPRLLD